MKRRRSVDTRELPIAMRTSRKAAPTGDSTEAWFYVNHTSIDVLIDRAGGVASCRLTRRQLERALGIMRDSK